MGAQRKPERHYSRRAVPTVKANAASFRGLAAAKEALCADTPGPSGEESLAQQEQCVARMRRVAWHRAACH